MGDNRLNIGFFTCHLDNDYTFELCKGVEYAAKEADVNLVLFPGMYLNASYNDPVNAKYDYQYNSIFYYASRKTLDALIVCIGSIGSFLSVSDMQSFLSCFDVPILTIEIEVPGYPYLYTEGSTGMRQAIEHLIKEHNKTKIGFVSGRIENADAVERLNVYKQVLTENNIPVEDGKIVYGNFSEYTEEIVSDLLDRNPDLEAVVFANDQMALGGYKVFKQRGLKIGKDILVSAYDNSPNSLVLSPSLTTVDNNIMDLGYTAVYQAMELCTTKTHSVSLLHSNLIKRDSCGCKYKRINQADSNACINCSAKELLDNFKNTFMLHYTKSFYSKRLFEKLDRFYLYFIDALYGKKTILTDLYESIDDFFASDLIYYFTSDMFVDSLNKLSSYLLLCTEDAQTLSELSKLISSAQAHLSLSLSARIYAMDHDHKASSWASSYMTRDTLLTSNNEKYCFQLILEKLLLNGFKSTYIYLYDDSVKQLPNGWWQIPDNLLFQACNVEGKITVLEGKNKIIPSSMIFHNSCTPQNRRQTLVVTPIFTNEIQHGVFVCESDIAHFNKIYSASLQLGTSLKFIALMKQQLSIQGKLEDTMTEINDKNDLLNHLYITDELTKLNNRRGFFEKVQKELASLDNVGRIGTITFVDMDNLKQVNDKFGHKEGDFALKSISNTLKASFPEGSIIARLGGDEFIAFSFITSQETVEEIASKLAKNTDFVNDTCGKPYYIDISHGTHTFICSDLINIEDEMIKADEILYTNKRYKRKSVIK